MSFFQTTHRLSNNSARLGTISTDHGDIQTPAFVPVGTQATIKSLTPEDMDNLGAQAALANTYHLYLRPGQHIVKQLGGLHKFMDYNKPIWTDSGGFQVFSLGIALEHGVGQVVDLFADDSKEEVALNRKIDEAKERNQLLDVRSLCKIDDEGATFMSHVDGTLHRWNAEKSMQIQSDLDADLIFSMDECTSPTHDYEYTKQSMYRSHNWELRSLNKFTEIQKARVEQGSHRQFLYGIVQGGPHQDLRTESAQFVASHDFDGVGIGGALVSKSTMKDILEWIHPSLPENKPRHLLGIGGIDDIFVGVEHGVDTFDCANPTRIARHGQVYLHPTAGGSVDNKWRLTISRKELKADPRPVDPSCDCYTCQHFSRAYLRHLYWARELTYFRLASIHNLHYMIRLMSEIRTAITDNTFDKLKHRWLA